MNSTPNGVPWNLSSLLGFSHFLLFLSIFLKEKLPRASCTLSCRHLDFSHFYAVFVLLSKKIFQDKELANVGPIQLIKSYIAYFSHLSDVTMCTRDDLLYRQSYSRITLGSMQNCFRWVKSVMPQGR